jgi:hypothetical protein
MLALGERQIVARADLPVSALGLGEILLPHRARRLGLAECLFEQVARDQDVPALVQHLRGPFAQRAGVDALRLRFLQRVRIARHRTDRNLEQLLLGEVDAERAILVVGECPFQRNEADADRLDEAALDHAVNRIRERADIGRHEFDVAHQLAADWPTFDARPIGGDELSCAHSATGFLMKVSVCQPAGSMLSPDRSTVRR